MNDPKHAPMESGGRIERHGQESGPLSPEMVEQRAVELALIGGRAASAVTDEDRRQAAAELAGRDIPLATDESRSDRSASRNPAEPLADAGHQTQSIESPDEQQLAEQETEEGVREAEHERMLSGQKSPPDTD